MIAELNSTSLKWGGGGIVVQMIGRGMAGASGGDPGMALVGLVLALVGTAMFINGLRYYAMSKGRHPAWGFMGFLSLLGLIILAVLPDLAPDGQAPDA